MYKYRFTIITVCYNAEKYIKGTILSLLGQSYDKYEYIIKDGGSTDKTMHIVHSLIDESDRIHIVSEKDKGIYDAMNQAVDMARGEYVYFLNAGDCFYSENVLKKISQFIGKHNHDVVYGDIIQVDRAFRHIRKYGRICSNRFYFLTGDCICHQALFARRELFTEKKFDTRFQVCADKEWQLSQISAGRKFIPVKFVVASVLADGFSASHLSELEEETKHCVDSYIKSMVWVYDIINYMKHNAVMVRILRAVENVLFFRK